MNTILDLEEKNIQEQIRKGLLNKQLNDPDEWDLTCVDEYVQGMIMLRFDVQYGVGFGRVSQNVFVKPMERAAIPSGAKSVMAYTCDTYEQIDKYTMIPGDKHHIYVSKFGIVLDE